MQSVIASGRPFQREWQALRPVLPSEFIPDAMQDVLTSHAARGVVALVDLRAQLSTMAASLRQEARAGQGWLEWAQNLLRDALAMLGLVDAPTAPVQVALARMDAVLSRAQLGAAIADAEALDPPLRSLLEGWLARVRARLAVEQAVQEAILRGVSAPFVFPAAATP